MISRLLPMSIVVTLLTCFGVVSRSDEFAKPMDRNLLTISDVIAIATSADPSITLAEAQIDAAKARADQYSSNGKPQLSFSSVASVSTGKVGQPPPSSETFGAITNSLTLPIPNHAKLSVQADQAVADLQNAQLQRKITRKATVAAVENAYFDVLRSQGTVDTAQEAVNQAQNDQQAAQKRYDDGVGAQIDILRAEAPVTNAQGDLAAAKAKLETSREQLNLLLHRPPQTPVTVVEPQITISDVDLCSTGNVNVTELDELKSANALVRSATAASKLNKFAKSPTVELSVSDTRSRDVTSFSALDVAQVSVTIPLIDSGLSHAQEAESIANLAAAKATVAQTSISLNQALIAAIGSVNEADSRYEPASVATQDAEDLLTKVRQGYKLGLYPIRDVIDTEATVRQAKLNLLQTELDREQSRYDLARALGKDQP